MLDSQSTQCWATSQPPYGCPYVYVWWPFGADSPSYIGMGVNNRAVQRRNAAERPSAKEIAWIPCFSREEAWKLECELQIRFGLETAGFNPNHNGLEIPRSITRKYHQRTNLFDAPVKQRKPRSDKGVRR